jgi:hypothetical protein
MATPSDSSSLGWRVRKALLRPDLSCDCAFSAKNPGRLLSIIAQFVQIRVKGVFFAGHFVIVACVFIHIAGSIFIFNISKGQISVPDLEKAFS